MFAGSLPLLILLVAAIGFWLDAARARELASALAQELCARHGVQFLDGSASLSSLSLKRTPQGLRFQRVFGFSYFTDVIVSEIPDSYVTDALGSEDFEKIDIHLARRQWAAYVEALR